MDFRFEFTATKAAKVVRRAWAATHETGDEAREALWQTARGYIRSGWTVSNQTIYGPAGEW